MKRNIKTFLIAAILITVPLFIFAQVPPTPDTPLPGTEMPSATAPIGNGTFILLTLAAAYAARKVYVFREVKEEEQK